MRKQDLVYIVKDYLKKQILDEGACAISPLGTESKVVKPPGGASFHNRTTTDGNTPRAMMSLELSSSKIVALVGVLNDRQQVEIVGSGEHVLENTGYASELNILKTVSGIRSAVGEALGSCPGYLVEAVYSNYSGHLSMNRLAEILIKEDSDAEIQHADIEQIEEQLHLALYSPGEEVILIQPDHYTIDDLPGIIDPVGMIGKRIEAYFSIVLGEFSGLRRIEKCASRANINLTKIYPSGVASSEAVLMEEEKEGSVAVIDTGATLTHIAVFQDGILKHAETIRLGGNNITRDIQQFARLTFERAEWLKKAYGAILPLNLGNERVIRVDQFNGRRIVDVALKDLAYVIEARVEELLSLSAGKILAALDDSKPDAGIVITGGGLALFPDIERFVRELTGVRCCVGSPDLYLSPGGGLPGEKLLRLMSPAYATSIGLLKMGLNGR